MKSFPKFLLIITLLTAAARADLASKILAKEPGVHLTVDSGTEKEVKPSGFDFDALKRLTQQFSPALSTPAPTKHTKISQVKTVSSAPNLADIVKSRRLNQDALKDPPAVSGLSLHPRSTGIPEFDDALFSTESLPIQANHEESTLRAKIQEIANSLSKFKTANLKYLNSIDIEKKNAALFTDAQKKVQVELESYRRQLDTVKEKAVSVKNEKNAAVLELEELVNQRAAKLRQVADLTSQNEALNKHYGQLEQQIALVEQGDKDIEGQVAGLTAKQDALKKQFDDLSKKYAQFQKEKQTAKRLVTRNQKEKKKLASKLDNLKLRITGEAPLNDQLLKEAADVDKETAILEAQIIKYQQESAQLDRQASQLDQMKAAAQRNLNDFGVKQKAQEGLKAHILQAHEQASRKQAALSDFEHDIKSKERACRCSRRQLSQILSQREMAQNNQQAIQGLMSNIQAINPTTTNMKLLNTLIEGPAPGSNLGLANPPHGASFPGSSTPMTQNYGSPTPLSSPYGSFGMPSQRN
jgi:hypothetical protein